MTVVAATVTDRRGILGGTDIASIFGVSPWKTAYDLYEEKTAPVLLPAPEPTPAQEKTELRLRRGKRLEPWVMEMLEEETGIFIRKKNQRYSDAEFPWMGCEIDFEFTGEEGECNGDVKTINAFAAGEWGQEMTDEIPLHYCLQFHWGLMITGRPLCLVAALIGADDLRVYEVKRDDELIGEMRKRAVHFWTHNVLKKIAPEPQTIADTNKILRKLGGFLVPGAEKVWNLVASFKKAKEEEKQARQKRDSIELEIKSYLSIQSQVAGLEETPKRFTLLGPDGRKSVLTCNLQHRAGYTVEPTDFYVLRT